MSELKRYEPSCDDVTIGSMDEELEGDYVEYADYARIKAAADGMAKALEAEDAAQAAWRSDVPHNECHDLSKKAADMRKIALTEYQEATR